MKEEQLYRGIGIKEELKKFDVIDGMGDHSVGSIGSALYGLYGADDTFRRRFKALIEERRAELNEEFDKL